MSASTEIFHDDQTMQDTSAIRKINNMLNSSRTRIQGLELLSSFLPQCSHEDFLHSCIGWMQNCCKIDGWNKSRDFTFHLLCQWVNSIIFQQQAFLTLYTSNTVILGNLLKFSSNYQELKKSVSFFITTRYFDFFFKYFLNSSAGWSCTETILLCYRGACGSFRENLEEHLKTELNKNLKISNTIFRCFALIPSVGGGGNEGINYKKNWKNYFIKFLNICHSVLNYLFADVTELQEFEIHEQFYDKEKERNIQYLEIQLYNHSNVLICMLLNQYPSSKSIPTDLILQLVCRGLALNPKNIAKRETANLISLQKLLPEIHCTLLSLLKALIVTCKNQLLPYSRLICKLIIQSLEWTASDFSFKYEKPFGRLRISTYETLCNWLIVARNGSCSEVISSVISNAVNDLKPKKDVVFLKETQIQNQLKRGGQTVRQVDSKLCLAALKTLQFLLKFEGVSLKPEEHKLLQEVVVKLLVEVQKNSTTVVIPPFAVSACRRELYCLLLELVYHPCPKWPPPTNFAMRLFSRGINDTSSQVSLFCSAALNFLTIIIHPQFDNGGFLRNENPESWKQFEAESQWRALKEAEKVSEVPRGEISEKAENFPACDKANSTEKIISICGESEISSDEDSKNTLTFSKDSSEACEKIHDVDEQKTKALHQMNLAENESDTKKRRASKEDLSVESIDLPFKTRLESDLIKERQETCHVDSNDAKTVSSESLNEEDQPKARYFLRSKLKASSEEPEEASKRISSPDSLKNTPARSLAKSAPSAQSAKKRPRTKSATRRETKSKTPEKNGQDEEDIKAAFNDSFVD